MFNAKSFHKNKKVYEWIREIKKDPSNEELKTNVILQYERLVKSIAQKFSRERHNFEDLVQVGMIGLLKAVYYYKPELNRSFESYAVPMIIGSMKRYIRDETWSIHVPRRIKELAPLIKKTADQLHQQLGRSPLIQEIATTLHSTEEEVLEAAEVYKSYQAMSIDYIAQNKQINNTTAIIDFIGTIDERFEHIENRVLLFEAFKTLTTRELAIITYVFYDHLSQHQIAKLLNISQMHVSRIQKKALSKLREVLKDGTPYH